jgi:uncharacterized protein (DUF2225 family)
VPGVDKTMSEETIRCPNCGYAMQKEYVHIINSSGKRTWKTTGNLFCYECKVGILSEENKFVT